MVCSLLQATESMPQTGCVSFPVGECVMTASGLMNIRKTELSTLAVPSSCWPHGIPCLCQLSRRGQSTEIQMLPHVPSKGR